MTDESHEAKFVDLLTEHQLQLRGFILASLGNHANSQDVLQRTNLTLWRKASEFRQGAPFLPWAITVARFEILAYLRDHKREQVVFSPDVVEKMSDTAAKEDYDETIRAAALRKCVDKLSDEHRRVINPKYVQNETIPQISDSVGRSSDGVKSLLLRIRQSLARCVEFQIASHQD